MTIENIIVTAILALIIGGAVAYMIKAKKSGKRCIGCPDGCSCQSGGCNGCHGKEKDGEKTE